MDTVADVKNFMKDELKIAVSDYKHSFEIWRIGNCLTLEEFEAMIKKEKKLLKKEMKNQRRK